jgi:hypothetical protein
VSAGATELLDPRLPTRERAFEKDECPRATIRLRRVRREALHEFVCVDALACISGGGHTGTAHASCNVRPERGGNRPVVMSGERERGGIGMGSDARAIIWRIEGSSSTTSTCAVVVIVVIVVTIAGLITA